MEFFLSLVPSAWKRKAHHLISAARSVLIPRAPTDVCCSVIQSYAVQPDVKARAGDAMFR
jgi:hypothetical protein